MIPNFTHNHVLPPYVGNPTVRTDLSPYPTDTLKLCKHFATSKERIVILKGYLAFRDKMNSIGITTGFQWLDGSFMENIEASEQRAPKDLDLITFFSGLTPSLQQNIFTNFIEFIDPLQSKNVYELDHYPIDYGWTAKPEAIIENTRYWLQLFTHNRLSVWKGMLRIELNTPAIDKEANEYLEQLKL